MLQIDEQHKVEVSGGDTGTVTLKNNTVTLTVAKDGVTIEAGGEIQIIGDKVRFGDADSAKKEIALAQGVVDRLFNLEDLYNKHTHVGNMGGATPLNPASMVIPPTVLKDVMAQNVLAK